MALKVLEKGEILQALNVLEKGEILQALNIIEKGKYYKHPTYVASNKVTLEAGIWLYGEHRMCSKMAAVSHDTSQIAL